MPLDFQLLATDSSSAARRASLGTAHGRVETPAFMAVGTRASVTGLAPRELEETGCQVVLGNTYHLMLRPGIELFQRTGGLHSFMGWQKPILTDSGGYQIFSLAHDCVVSERGAFFKAYTSQQMEMLTPERSIEVQAALGSDMMMVLDVCAPSKADEPVIVAAMERTHRWALRSLEARRRLAETSGHDQSLFAIAQGALDLGLRRRSAEFLTAHAFDGFAIGGVAVGDSRAERDEVVRFTAEQLPANKPRYLMGVGTPPDLLEAIWAGVDLFDCVIPTRLAQQGSAFTQTGRVRLTRTRYFRSDEALDASCSCSTCRSYSRSYLHHLFKANEPLGPRLLSHHNLHYYNALLADARVAIERGVYSSFARSKLDQIDRHEDGQLKPRSRALSTESSDAGL